MIKKILLVAVLFCTAVSCSSDTSSQPAKRVKDIERRDTLRIKGYNEDNVKNILHLQDSLLILSFELENVKPEDILNKDVWGENAHIFYFDSTGRVQNK